MKALYVTLTVIVIDQITKLIVKGISIPFLNLHFEGMSYGESINVIGDFFKITFVENPGLAFGIDVNDSAKLLLSIFSLIASAGIFYYLYKSKHQKLVVRAALALILGGAIGNLIDRTFYGVIYGYAPIFYGRVVDFFNVDFFDFTILGRTYDRWPIFNIADASVTIGVILLVIFHGSVKEDVHIKQTTDSGEIVKKYDELSTINLSVADVKDSNGKED
ncbi:signal peptidase II [Melioribacter sp. OK-6-Me]|uniref:signal peptidase II n=1 Tax=unclassified Melioribacter TaxID=2627329 RepID=UPI003EDAF0FD